MILYFENVITNIIIKYIVSIYFCDIITGDLFERLEDVDNPNIWLEAGSEDPVQQMKNRSIIADIADWIVPGHGPKFKVTAEIKKSLRDQAGDTSSLKKGDL